MRELSLPRYFFHLLHPDREPVIDYEGIALEDDVAAKREGMRSLGELMMEAISSRPMPFGVSVQIVREDVGVIDLPTGHLTAQSEP